MEIKIRYRFRNRETGVSLTAILNLLEIENQRFTPPVFGDFLNWDVLSRDFHTGLKDKDGKEIFEEDRVRFRYANIKELLIGTVRFARTGWDIIVDGRGSFDSKYLLDGRCEVIGNIHENKELEEEKA